MKIFEIILKVLFLGGSIYSIQVESVSYPFLISYLIVCLILGIVLIFNKKTSYNYPTARKDFVMRRIEGALLILFAGFVFYFQG